MNDTFDFVVVGGGSAGSIAASELACAGHSVLLLEGGDDADRNPETLRADGYREAFINDRLMIERFSTEQPGCGGRRLFLGSGRGLGGSGGINAMVYTRGSREDYESFGDGWRWNDVEGDFRALEARLRVRRREATGFTERAIRAAGTVGLRHKDDLNDGDLSGVLGYEWMNFEGAARRSSYVAFVRDRAPKSLVIRTRARALRVVFEGHRAVGVEYEQSGTLKIARAHREVILAAGALETPRILLLSGVGDDVTLRRCGVPVVHHSPAVGQNLHDHPNVSLFFLGHRPIDCNYPQLYGFDEIRGSGAPPDTCYVFYPARSSFREGLMRMVPAMALPESAHREGTAKRALRGALGTALAAGLAARFIERMWGIVVILGKPRSRGSIRITSSNPDTPPAIDPAYFADPDDLRVMIEGVARARRIAGAAPLADLGNRELLPGPLGRSDEGLEPYVQQNAMTTYHYAGTCRMGDGPEAVVDRRLRVRGLRGLRVADASIMPVAPVSALNAPSMLIGMKAAAFAHAESSS